MSTDFGIITILVNVRTKRLSFGNMEYYRDFAGHSKDKKRGPST